MISQQALQEIQGRLDILQVIGGYVGLKKAGRNFKALCPFHPEKTPSFVVYPEKQFFICYGCGAGGDLITFVMKQEHLEFREAVEVLAQKAGVEVPEVGGDSAGGRPDQELYRAHEVAARFYQELLTKAPEGELARRYLQGRGIQPAAWEAFGMGYAPNRWDGLVAHASQSGVAPDILERAGLAVRRENSQGWYDRFRHRVIFPIWDARGRVIAFGGRVLEEADGPKYLNSPETELYVKGRLLYGMHLAVPQIREKDFCIVVEGYVDVVSPAQHEIRNVVASMGTSLTEQQVRLIRRHTRHVVMVYDGDYAGKSATLRGLDLFLEAEMRVKVAVLPGGTDPDSLIRSQGVEAFVRILKDSQELFDYKLGWLTSQFNPKELEGRVGICQEMLPTIKRVPNAIRRGEYIRRLAEILGIAEDLLWKEMGRVRLTGSTWKPEGLAELPARAKTPAMGGAEDVLAGLLLEEPRRVEQVEGRLDLEELEDPQVRHLITWLLERFKEGRLPASHTAFLNELPRAEGVDWQPRLAQWLAWADSIEEKERSLDEVLERIRSNRHRASLESLRDSIRQAEQARDDRAATRLIVEYNRLMKGQLTQ